MPIQFNVSAERARLMGLNPIVIKTDLKQLDSPTVRSEEQKSPADSSRVEMKQLRSRTAQQQSYA